MPKLPIEIPSDLTQKAYYNAIMDYTNLKTVKRAFISSVKINGMLIDEDLINLMIKNSSLEQIIKQEKIEDLINGALYYERYDILEDFNNYKTPK